MGKLAGLYDRIRKQEILFLFLVFTAGVLPVKAQNSRQDLESWNVVSLTNHFNDKWSLSLQEETRFQDNITALNQIILKLNATIKFNEKVGLNFGLKYIYRPTTSSEWEPWQELLLPHSYKNFHVSHNVRLEERFYQGIDGIIPRIRYLFNYHIPVGKKNRYITGYAAVRFNLVEKGVGPIYGFEQIRLRVSYGIPIGDFMDIEVGYLYRYEINRDALNFSDHVIHLQIPFSTGSKKAAKQAKKFRN